MCTQPIEIHKKDSFTGQVLKHVVPCGKCYECRSAKQNENAVLSYIEACKRGKLVLVTLTYNDEHLPFRFRFLDEDANRSSFFCHGRLLNDLRALYFSKFNHYGEIHRFIMDGSEIEFCPSLCRSDFRNFIKRARVRYEREHNESLPDFSYMLVGEYGEQNHRPHYHCLFYGLDESIVKEICLPWQNEFGYIDISTVERFNEHASYDGFFYASRYLGKYLTKGCDDCESVLKGLAEKSRVLRSIGFGIPEERQLASLLSFSALKIMCICHSRGE